MDQAISPERVDPFADVTPARNQRTYADVMQEQKLARSGTHTHTHTYTHIYTHSDTQTRTHIRTHTHRHTHTRRA
jgi:hypothetical protein